jgi:hypothetical protein
MPVGLVRKWTVVAIIAGVLGVIACKDDDDDPILPPVDSGSPGGTTGGGLDAGSDSGGGTGGTGGTDAGKDGGGVTYEAGQPCPGWDGGPIMCGTQQCFWHRTLLTCANPGCVSVNDASVCGIDTETLGGVDAGLPPFIQYDAPGADSPSCGAVVDSFEPTPDGGAVDGGAKGNGLIDTSRKIVTAMGSFDVLLRYPGCCTPQGFCSGHTGKGEGAVAAGGSPMYNPSNAGYGCLNNQIFFATNPDGAKLRCDSTTGAFIPPTDGGTTDGGGSDAGGDASDDDAGGDGG